MAHTIKKLDNGQQELSITVTPAEYEPQLIAAAKSISNQKDIKGFRKGKAPFDVVKKEAGDMTLLQEALPHIVQHAMVAAVQAEKLETVGSPDIQVEKIAPENDLTFKAIVSTMPEVTLPKLESIKVTAEKPNVTDEQVQETIDALRGMKASEIIKSGKATKEDKLIIDMNMSIDNVPVEGGQAKDYQVYLSEKHYIPGFNDKLIGASKDEKVAFTLDFPEDHYQKMLAGKKVAFDVTVKEVYKRELPAFDDAFAKTLGKDTVEELKGLIRSNLEHEQLHKAQQKTEIAILEALIEKSTFSHLPAVVIDHEKQKIFHELQGSLEKNGITTEQYLSDLKKTEAELLKDFTAQAEKRAKSALISRAIAKSDPSLSPTAEELKAEVEKIKAMYAKNEEQQKHLDRPEVQETIATTMQNRKVMAHLFQTITGEEMHQH